VGYSGNPDFIIHFHNRVLWYQFPVPGYDHFKRINALFGENLFNSCRAVIKDPAIRGRNDEFHFVTV
jgi:hypothetical protein